jgi:alanine racemase
MPQRALARVNLAAIERNVARLRRELSAHTELCAVVKADGYGHGAVPVARAALSGGASWVAVASAQEAFELRGAGIEAPILVMGAISAEELPLALAARADLTAWSEEFVEEVARTAGERAPVALHVKLDTGMGRLGTRHQEEALAVASRIIGSPDSVRLRGAMTHLATADDDPQFASHQLERFEPFVAELRRRVPDLLVHAANSAGTINHHGGHFDMVRCGIAIYGCDPMHEDPAARELEPALELTSYIAAVKEAAVGDSVGYGRRFVAREPTWIGTLPIGYADGVRRALTNNCDVLVGGVRYPLVGTVSMDNITIDLGPSPGVRVGDPATLIGRDSGGRQTVEELARRIGTINYEVVCGISKRVPRQYHHDGEPL